MGFEEEHYLRFRCESGGNNIGPIIRHASSHRCPTAVVDAAGLPRIYAP